MFTANCGCLQRWISFLLVFSPLHSLQNLLQHHMSMIIFVFVFNYEWKTIIISPKPTSLFFFYVLITYFVTFITPFTAIFDSASLFTTPPRFLCKCLFLFSFSLFFFYYVIIIYIMWKLCLMGVSLLHYPFQPFSLFWIYICTKYPCLKILLFFFVFQSKSNSMMFFCFVINNPVNAYQLLMMWFLLVSVLGVNSFIWLSIFFSGWQSFLIDYISIAIIKFIKKKIAIFLFIN